LSVKKKEQKKSRGKGPKLVKTWTPRKETRLNNGVKRYQKKIRKKKQDTWGENCLTLLEDTWKGGRKTRAGEALGQAQSQKEGEKSPENPAPA